MSKLNIRFRDPSSGQMHSVQGEVVQKLTQTDTQSTQELRNNPNDGQVDLFIHMDKRYGHSSPTQRESVHLQLDTAHLTDAQAEALAEAIRSGNDGAIQVEGQRRFNVLTVQTDLWNERSDLFGTGEHNPDVSLTGSDENGVFLSQDGIFTTASSNSSDLKTSATALYRAAEAGDQLAEGENIFSRNGVSLETKQKTFDHIRELLGETHNGDLSVKESAQLRSSAATVMTEMLMSLGTEGVEGEFKQNVFETLHKLIEGETIGGLKESMIFNAVRVQSGLSEEAIEVVNDLRAQIAPTAPPTDKWFANGKRELNISFAAGHGENFYEGATEWLEKEGFEIVEEGSESFWRTKPRKLQLKKRVNGEEYTVNIDMRNYKDDTFKDIDDDAYDMVVYQGHSNLGNNTRKSVANAPDATGKDKLIFLGLCSGKDNIDRVREAFPEAQLVTTFNSSYFNTKAAPGGGRQFTQGEDIKALMQMVNGALERESWSEISENIKDHAVGWHHKDSTIGNYVTPFDLQLGGKFRDIDNDGTAMTMDRHFNVDVLKIRPGVSSMFEAKDNGSEGQKLNGELPHLAAIFANTIDLYNPTYDNFSHKGRIMSDGFYKGGADDPVVRFETRVENGEKSYVMQVNEKFAHMGEEALRAITMVEYNKHLAETESNYPIRNPVERELVGLLTAAASLSYDAGYRDAAVFDAIVQHYDLPEGLKWSDAGKLINDEHHDYTGSLKMARKWMNQMDPALIEELRTKLG